MSKSKEEGMITTEVDKATSVLDHRLLGHTDSVKITSAKGIDILRDILNDILQHGKRDNMPIRANTQLSILRLHQLITKFILSVHMTMDFMVRRHHHCGGRTIQLQFNSISCMDHHRLVIQK